MRLAFVCAFVFAIGCGPTAGTGGGDDTPVEDTDGDGITDADEGRASNVDTDGDGRPDYDDADSDGDGIPDSREAGDADPATAPVDSDGDGTPDFRDLDSDANGREDRIDGDGDADGDTLGDYADPDDDGDNIYDVDELGPNPLAPLDTDGDGTPDYRDIDSDDDTISDVLETNADFDSDGTGNFQDLDSDGDCITDQLEARGTPPADTDMDNRPDYLDRDSDNDGLADGTEDANCNGMRDGAEPSATDDDTDNDGVSDLVESVAGTNANDPNSNPQANGDYVFVEPYMKPQTPVDDDLDFSTKLQAVDIYVMLDRSGSMSTEITAIKNNLAAVVNQVACPPLGSGAAGNCIPDLWAGAGTIGYSGTNGQAFTHSVDVQPNPSFANVPITEPAGGCCAEPLTFGAYAAVTGLGGGANFGLGTTVPARASCAGSPAANGGYTTFGYPCFRQGALPVVLLATDEPPLSAGDTNKNPSWDNVVKPQYLSTKARVIGILGDNISTNTDVDLRKMATDTGAVDAANNNAPLVFNGSGAGAPAAIKTGILALANGLPLDINAVTADVPGDAVNAVTAFVDHIQTLQLGTAQCANGLTDVDTNADTFKDKYLQVRTGTPVCWKVVSKPNTTVPATTEPQLFRATITVFGDGVTQLDQRDVFFLVPPEPIDDPLQ
ncbi:MAG: VWA domain-containing protein [Deltaproteobacteria bacterium]|nr:VWA domain-containing protein [Deltaproteobacteria bacterium]